MKPNGLILLGYATLTQPAFWLLRQPPAEEVLMQQDSPAQASRHLMMAA